MKKKSNKTKFTCLMLAAGRGKDDLMAREFRVDHKCLLPVQGRPMIVRVLDAVKKSPSINKVLISIEDENVLTANREVKTYLGAHKAGCIKSKERASVSVLAATKALEFPILVTTADHALLTPEIVEDFIKKSLSLSCDLAVGLVHEKTISKSYPDVKRTYLRFSDGGYSGSNLFALMNKDSLKVVNFWQHIEKERKKPWKLIRAFGLKPLFLWLTGRLDLSGAFLEASQILDTNIKPIVLTDAHASIDVDKKSDHELVEQILKS